MHALEESEIDCPYCGQHITLLIDTTQAPAQYIEDCAVCCQPMVIGLTVADEDEEVQVTATREND